MACATPARTSKGSSMTSSWSRELDRAIDPDEIPEPPEEAVTRPGNLWVLGPHRFLCGDSGKAEDLDRLFQGALVHLVNTDPPYNVRAEPRSNNAIASGNTSFKHTHHQKLDLARHAVFALLIPRSRSPRRGASVRRTGRSQTTSWAMPPSRRCSGRGLGTALPSS